MEMLLRVLFLLSCFRFAAFSDAIAGSTSCKIELECEECIPDNMAVVTSHRAADGRVEIGAGDEAILECAPGYFMAYPLKSALSVVCDGGRFKVTHDGSVKHILELGCQANVFEDVLHDVEYCSSGHQGRAYQVQTAGGVTRHLATVCFDQDLGVARMAVMSAAPRNWLALPPHEDSLSPLSLLGNFNHMFDSKTRREAETLYSDEVRMNRRLHELFKYDKVTFAEQTLTSGEILSKHYFEDQNMRVTNFVSNRVAVWRSVAAGNLMHTHQDVARLLALAQPKDTLRVYAGTHDIMALRTSHARLNVFLKPGRFPVPKYLWTVVHDTALNKSLAIVVINDPFVAVSEIRESVFCESSCSSASWLHTLRRNHNYENPLFGLAFCCTVHNFAAVVNELPKSILNDIPHGVNGMLLDYTGSRKN